ncbi:MAG: carbohydrate ABC transporter permease [Treponema sp.]|jgi:raffinose/stachyose/melibiose transport system permease protein|nr:carbohydrate ABC transporter permease [Treponema sp.]
MKIKNNWPIFSFIISIVVGFIMLFPFFMVLLNSFKGRISIIRDPMSFSGFVGFDNYVNAFKTMNYLGAIKNSIAVSGLSLVVIVVFSSMFAYFLERWQWKINKIIFLVIVASMIIPFQTLMIPLVSIYGSIGVLNSGGSLIFFYLGFGMAMATFMYHGFVKGVPKELEEAALLDGCGKLETFWRIVFPNLAPITATIIILDLLWIWNDYLLPSLVLIRETQRTLPLSTFYFFGNYTSEFGYGMAALIMSIAPILILYLILQRQIISGVMNGSIK